MSPQREKASRSVESFCVRLRVCVCEHAVQARSGSRKQNLLGGPDVGSAREKNKSGEGESGG